ncbi:hypothetical protein OUZ56_017151 [Daphnia magna]|uniref:Secreted protein n=1 Tax=Daphnia magna TaxID=35525 RepID=A0ABR0ASP8_9CRUS|nr:hypothetical protein OUZ56_017151 [Daphnia magna]
MSIELVFSCGISMMICFPLLLLAGSCEKTLADGSTTACRIKGSMFPCMSAGKTQSSVLAVQPKCTSNIPAVGNVTVLRGGYPTLDGHESTMSCGFRRRKSTLIFSNVYDFWISPIRKFIPTLRLDSRISAVTIGGLKTVTRSIRNGTKQVSYLAGGLLLRMGL